jgi:hypothetical protein
MRCHVDVLAVWGMLLAGALGFYACAKPLPPAPPPAPAPRETATAPVEAPTPEAAPKPLADPALIGAMLRDAYRQEAQGHAEEARAAFVRVVELARAHAPAGGGGPEDFGNVVSARGGYAAVHGKHGVLFFRAETGEPVAFEPGASLDENYDDVLPEPPLFVLRIAEEQVLYDAIAGAPVVRSTRIRVAPGGRMAVAFETGDCRWHEWDLLGRRETHVLEARGGICKGGDQQEESFITPDERWLVALGGRWDLRTWRLHRFPEGSAYGPSGFPGVSSDRRFVAYFRRRRPVTPEELERPERVTLALFDLRNETETRVTDPSFSSLSNSRALDFADAPLRLHATDYTRWVYAVPSLRLIVRVPSASGAAIPLTPDQERALTSVSLEPVPEREGFDWEPEKRLRTRACDIGGFPVPRAICGPAGATAP